MATFRSNSYDGRQLRLEVWQDGKRFKLDARCLMAEKSRLCSKGGRDTWGPP